MSKDGIKKICIHWSAGAGKANSTDKSHYHYMIESDGKVVEGAFSPKDNVDCTDGKYAAHTQGGNTGVVGIALCGMFNYVSGKPSSTKYPLTAIQCEAAWKLVARLCKEYNIPIEADTVFTHYEFDKKRLGRVRKIDISYLHYQPQLKENEIGDFIRNKVFWYFQHLN